MKKRMKRAKAYCESRGWVFTWRWFYSHSRDRLCEVYVWKDTGSFDVLKVMIHNHNKKHAIQAAVVAVALIEGETQCAP